MKHVTQLIKTGLVFFGLSTSVVFGWGDAFLAPVYDGFYTGFWENRIGQRLHSVPNQKGLILGESRVHLDADIQSELATFLVAGDLVWDVDYPETVRLNEGLGWLDLRTAAVLLRPTSWMDLKIGRQIVTWGTGDLVFINDLFSKDWVSFLSGRQDAYLKAPSDVVKASLFSSYGNVDIVYAPQFDSDRYIRGERISYFNGALGRVTGRDARVEVQTRDQWFDEDEWYLRAAKSIHGFEAAAYYYDGFWKSPAGVDMSTGMAVFPKLSVVGASVRGPAFGGIVSAEVGDYVSQEDVSGSNAAIANSEWRGLIGFEHEAWTDATIGLQYYLEVMQSYDAYVASMPSGAVLRDEYRHVVTIRLTQFLLDQRLTVSLFNFYSPSDEDGYFRPSMTYSVSDRWRVEAGAQYFYGRSDTTFFGQFQDNSSVFGAVRVGF